MGATAILKLQRVGFSAEQVEALAEFMDAQAASKADLERVEHKLETQIAEGKAELQAEIADLRSDMRLLEQRMTIRLGTMMVVSVGAVAALVKLR